MWSLCSESKVKYGFLLIRIVFVIKILIIMGQKEFIQICSDRKFWLWIRTKSIVAYKIPSDKEKFLKSLYKKIENRNYYPSPPEEYLTINKGYGVVRTIPSFQLEDLCIYYYCARKLEKYIAVNYVSGTYGGFGLSGKLRQLEEKNISQVKSRHRIVEIGGESFVFKELSGYPTLSTLNPKAWYTEWNDFTKKLYFDSCDFGNGFVADLDIANFYDSIQLDNLEYKLRKYVPHQCNDVIYLVMHFLKYWNRHINFYRQQGAGIPQDIFGECSRILANFYLQSYDRQFSKYCGSLGGEYFRYADDQVVFADSKEKLEVIIAKASSLLMREGLNLNQKKVKIMTIKEFKKYYSFQNFINLAQTAKEDVRVEILRKEIDFYLKNRNKLRKSGFSILKRILGILAKTRKRPKNFTLLKKHLLSSDILVKNYALNDSDLGRIYILLTQREKKKFIKLIDSNIESCLYTMYLYHVRMFYKSIKQPTRVVNSRIKWVDKFYNFKKMNA